MVFRRQTQQQQQAFGPMFGGGMQTVPGATFVSGEQLKQTEPALEALVGALSGAFTYGGMFGVGGAALYNFSKGSGHTSLGTALSGSFKNNLPWILGATAVGAVIGGAVRYSRASKHNEWASAMMDHVFSQQQSGQNEPSPERAAPVGKFTEKLHSEAGSELTQDGPAR